MVVGDVCSKDVVIVFRSDTTANACRLMRENHIGSVVVVDDGRRNAPVGMITDRDVAIGPAKSPISRSWCRTASRARAASAPR